MNAIRVLLADDHALVRAGLRTLIEKIASASPWLALLMLALVWPGAVVQSAVEMPRTIRVVMDNAYAPYSFQSGDRKLQGILVDQWQAWEKKTGIKVEMHALDWGEALRRMRAGEFDVIDSIVMTPERRDYFDFTPAYTPIEASIFFRNDISGITDIASLKGFPVGVKAGDQHIDKLKENGVTTVIPFQNNDEIIEAARQRKINVFVVDDPSALYLLNKMGIGSEFRHSAPIFRDELRRAVRKGDAALLRTVSEGFAAIEPGELKQIDEKWFGRTVNWIGHYLTYAGYAAAVAMLLVAGLVGWNRTLRKKILQRTAALSESEQRFRRLVELMPVAVYVCDRSGIIQSYNRRAVELWGREPKSGDTAQRYCASLRLWSPDGKLVPHEESKMAEVLRTGVPAHDLEVVIERPDGSSITVLVNIAPLRNGDGELVGALNCFQDITERKQVQDRLRRSEEKFKALFGIAPVGISVLDGQHNIVDANPALEQITRLSKEELLNGTYRRRTYLNADGTPKPTNKLPSERAINDNRPINDVETGIVTENGEIIWTQVSVAPLALPDASAVVITQDITERKLAEQASRESETRFRQVAENISAVFWLSNPEATLLHYVSPAYEKIWGRSCDSLYAEPRSWMDSVHPDDRERLAEDERLQTVGGRHDHTYRIVRPDGSLRWIRGRAFPVCDESGDFIRVAGIAEDITERKKAEDRLREYEKVVEGLEEMIVVVDRNYRYLLANRAFLKYRGIEREQLVGRLVEEVLNEGGFENVTKRKLDECLHGKPVQYEMTYRYPDRGERDLLISYFPIEGPAGVDRVACVLQDITERNRAAKELEEANHRLRILSRRLFEVQEQERRHLARELHDEIGQALTAAKINLQSVTGNGDSATFARLQETTAILDRLLGQVRQISLDLHPSLLDDLGLAPALRSLLDQQARRAGLRAQFSAVEPLANIKRGIQTAGFRIAQEAITNILRHANAGFVSVHLRTETGELRMKIVDDGRGFDLAEIEGRTCPDRGFGLMGMKERAASVGGRVQIVSSPRTGTTVDVSLPLNGSGQGQSG